MDRTWGGSAASAFAAEVDRAALAVLERVFLAGRRPDLSAGAPARLARLRGFYGDPRLLEDPERFYVHPASPPAVAVLGSRRIAGGERLDVSFESGFVPLLLDMREGWLRHDANRTARARLFLHRAPARAAAVCLHAWGGGSPLVDERVLAARRIFSAGLDVALLVLPFHGARTPRRAPFRGHAFPSPNLARTNEAMAQTVRDVRSLALHLRECGIPRVGLLGMSLGAYAAALVAGLDPVAFAVAILPISSLAELVWSHGERHPVRRRVEAAGFTFEDLRRVWAVHEPLSYAPRVPRERLLVVAGTDDRIAPASHAETLARHWGIDVTWFAGGHLAHFGRRSYLARVQRFLEAAADGPPGSPPPGVGSQPPAGWPA